MNDRGTLVYVHGAMDRAPQVADHVARIEQGLALQGVDLDVVSSDWGEAVGATLERIDLAIPGDGSISVSAEPAALRSVLWQGPFSELQRLADSSGVRGPVALASNDFPRDADTLLAIAAGGATTDSAGMAAACRAGARAVGASEVYARARCADIPEFDLVAATARAIQSRAQEERAIRRRWRSSTASRGASQKRSWPRQQPPCWWVTSAWMWDPGSSDGRPIPSSRIAGGSCTTFFWARPMCCAT